MTAHREASTEGAHRETSTENTQRKTLPPTTFMGFLKGMGPGIVVVLSWLGTGDFISSAVSGSTYGYALIWTLVLAVGSRYFIVSTMSKYQLCNAVGDETILDGYRRLWKGFPLYIGVTTSILGFVYVSFLAVAAGTALNHLAGGLIHLGDWGTPAWAIVSAAAATYLAFLKRTHYRGLEILAQLTMAALVVCFLVALIGTGIDVSALVKGMALDLPPGENGYITAVTTAVALIGAVGGSAANLLYPYLMHEKGWRGAEFRRLQRYDLITGTTVMFGLVLAVWVVAAETLHGTGASVDSEQGLVLMMERAVGPAGPTLMWLAIFFVVFDNIVTQPRVFVQMLAESVYKSRPDRLRRLQAKSPDTAPDQLHHTDKLFKSVLLFIMLTPVIFSLPFAPDLIVLTLLGNGLSVVTVPALMVGLVAITMRKDLMLPGHANRWWENLVLAGIGAVGIWATYELVVSIVGTVSHG
ncbi:Nramp family divalent metal transporter [Streptomyces winkii]|uniref:Nramp family divalent metal transporter n=1 Tax=Streptomyces winkii TaxID=3051178 RepID=UPI0028D3CD2A|nr:Nramp family divalent metal transporter [Streptomyces sp. DSM 40971]